jgi:hypothetical protein
MPIDRVLLPGSDRAPRADPRLAGTPNLAHTIDVSQMLRRRAALDLARHGDPTLELLVTGVWVERQPRRQPADKRGAERRSARTLARTVRRIDMTTRTIPAPGSSR